MEPIWHESYIPQVPHHIDLPVNSNLLDVFLNSVKDFPDHPVVSNFGTAITYRELNQLSQYVANYLKFELKLSRGARVAIMMPNVIQAPVLMLGILRAGMVVVNVNPLYTSYELLHQVNDAMADALFVVENFANTVERCRKKLYAKHIIITALGDSFAFLKRSFFNFAVRKIKKMVPSYHIDEAISYLSVLKEGAKHVYTDVPIHPDDLAFLQYTGGTTGVAKGAELTHRNVVSNIEQIKACVKPCMNMGNDRLIVALPLYHIFSLTVCFFAFIAFGSECILITNPRDLDGFVKILANTQFTIFAGVNTLFNALIHHKRIHEVDFSHLRLTASGGMALQKKIADEWLALTGNVIIEGYGLTETSPVVSFNRVDNKAFNHSIGLPLPSTDIKIIDDQGQELPFDEVGELCVKGPQVMRGYWKKPEETSKVLDEQGWLKTGDMARVDAQGYVYIVDRKKDMIIVSGFNVYPNEIEDVIALMDGVKQVAVIGVPNEHTTEAVKAFIVKSDPKLTQEMVVEHCQKHLTRYKIPKEIEFRFDLPLSNVGKVIRRLLKDEDSQKRSISTQA
jgi:long-chain acyl-CoA synthetase